MLETIRKSQTDSTKANISALSSPDCRLSDRQPADSWQISAATAGLQRCGELWSDLDALCQLLHVPSCTKLDIASPLFQHRRYRSGQCIHSIGQKFDALFAVHSGFVKTRLIDEGGGQHILGFPMKGDLFGVDGIHTRRHTAEAVALTDCNLVLIPFNELNALARSHSSIETLPYYLIGRELERQQTMVGMLGSLCAEVKVARFLVSLSDRFASIGYAKASFILRMSRHEIGCHLGLTLETISRTLSALNACGLITVQRRHIELNDIDALRKMLHLPADIPRPKPSAWVRGDTSAVV